MHQCGTLIQHWPSVKIIRPTKIEDPEEYVSSEEVAEDIRQGKPVSGMTKTKSQKARARKAQAAQAKAQHRAQGPPNHRRKKWFIGVDNFRMGSGDAPRPKRSRARNGGLDLVSLAPEERGTQSSFSRGQLVTQDEFIAVLNASVTFQATPFVLQPGLAANTPWLAQISTLYQKYKIHKWEYYYKPIVSEFDPIGQRGKVIMSFDSDVAGLNLTTFQQAEGMQPHVDFMPYQKASLPLSGRLYSQTNTGLFVRSGAAPAGADPKTYDAGVLYVCTQGMSGSGSMGELHARYVVELINPILPNTVAPPLNYSLTNLYQSGKALTSGVRVTADALLFSANGLNIDVNGGNVTMPAGIFRLDFNANVTVTAGNASTVSLQLQVNGVPRRGTTSGEQLTAGSIISAEYNGSYVIHCNGGEIIILTMLASFTGTAVSDFGLQISTV